MLVEVPLFSALIFILDIVVGVFGTSCSLSISNDRLLPVPFINHTTHYVLLVPQVGYISLKTNEKMTVLCPGPGNYNSITRSNLTSITCVNKDEVRVFRHVVKFDSIRCKKTVKAEVKKTTAQCGNNNGYIYKIGYQVTKEDWVTFIEVCHVPKTGSTIYTQHVIHGRALKFASKIKYPSSSDFSTAGLNDEVTASLAYTQTNQKAVFNKIFESSVKAGEYISKTSYLARGHLSPNADFILPSSRHSTYFYINAAPQWQSINAGSWKSIETTVRKMSLSYDSLTVITGTHGVLSYKSKNGTPVEVYLSSDKRLPVPKYFWKLVYAPSTKKAIVFVILNDPFIEKVQNNDIICPNICQSYGYNSALWSKIKTGYAFCCDIDSFKKVVRTTPSLTVTGVLHF